MMCFACFVSAFVFTRSLPFPTPSSPVAASPTLPVDIAPIPTPPAPAAADTADGADLADADVDAPANAADVDESDMAAAADVDMADVAKPWLGISEEDGMRGEQLLVAIIPAWCNDADGDDDGDGGGERLGYLWPISATASCDDNAWQGDRKEGWVEVGERVKGGNGGRESRGRMTPQSGVITDRADENEENI
ncbi:unnamed protein product [Closterium sp. NIES-53]